MNQATARRKIESDIAEELKNRLQSFPVTVTCDESIAICFDDADDAMILICFLFSRRPFTASLTFTDDANVVQSPFRDYSCKYTRERTLLINAACKLVRAIHANRNEKPYES